MSQKKIDICGTFVHPGEVAKLAMPMPEQYSCAPLYMPLKVIHGVAQGPCLVVFSVLKGKELNGLEIANRLIDMIDPKKLSGTIIAIPVVNVFGLTRHPLTLPSGRDLVDCFPGDDSGSYGHRLAHLITEEIFKKADYCIECQTGDINHNILPQVYCNFEDATAKQLAKAFCSPVITNAALNYNSMRRTTEELQLPLLVYQAGEALRFDDAAIELGIEGIINVMTSIKMLDGNITHPVSPIFSRDEEWLLAHKSGILHAEVSLGQTIEINDVIGRITDPFGAGDTETLRSTYKGVVVGINTSPLIQEGSQIFKIASFLDDDKAEHIIDEWDKQQPDSYLDRP